MLKQTSHLWDSCTHISYSVICPNWLLVHVRNYLIFPSKPPAKQQHNTKRSVKFIRVLTVSFMQDGTLQKQNRMGKQTARKRWKPHFECIAPFFPKTDFPLKALKTGHKKYTWWLIHRAIQVPSKQENFQVPG